MGLSSLVFKTETIKFSGGEFAVRGLSTDDLVKLIDKHRPVMERVFNDLTKPDLDLSGSEAKEIGLGVLKEAPSFMAFVIALAADEPDNVKTALKLPLDVQISAIEAIGRLTFETEGGLKNVLAVVTRMLRGATESMVALRT